MLHEKKKLTKQSITLGPLVFEFSTNGERRLLLKVLNLTEEMVGTDGKGRFNHFKGAAAEKKPLFSESDRDTIGLLAEDIQNFGEGHVENHSALGKIIQKFEELKTSDARNGLINVVFKVLPSFTKK